ncbi:hypothetical protein DdX_21067 [Ditylenchus destructor]|uniref:Uncharacterized protein n=1 Tax=Ditylenchus destructor TaxID=166010 RepID=A0AAD4MG52_9BILA|nr:hypothetical protein DdX_21067 [Ditylenchus destructor]
MPFVLSHRELSFDTSLASGGGQEPKIPRNALRANFVNVGGPMSEMFVPFVLVHPELSFDTSLASGGGQQRKISTNALRLKISAVCGPISKIFCHSFCLTESYHLTPHSPLEVVRNARSRQMTSGPITSSWVVRSRI